MVEGSTLADHSSELANMAARTSNPPAAIAEELLPQPPACPDIGLHQIIKLTDYSSLPKLLAVTAYALRFINNLCRSRPKLNGPLTAEELSSAQTKWIQACQQLR